MTEKRIYKITVALNEEEGVHLIRATNRAQALRHATEHHISAEVASQDDLVHHTSRGVKVQDAHDPKE